MKKAALGSILISLAALWVSPGSASADPYRPCICRCGSVNKVWDPPITEEECKAKNGLQCREDLQSQNYDFLTGCALNWVGPEPDPNPQPNPGPPPPQP
jgi:hypothetical protein